ncbi:hypothetical protein T439DRAFT_327807 [Meredithblackwellia eburnea MCA 4105]
MRTFTMPILFLATLLSVVLGSTTTLDGHMIPPLAASPITFSKKGLQACGEVQVTHVAISLNIRPLLVEKLSLPGSPLPRARLVQRKSSKGPSSRRRQDSKMAPLPIDIGPVVQRW